MHLAQLSLVAAFFITAAVIAGFIGGRYFERGRFNASSARLAVAVEALHTGEDGAALSMLIPLADAGNPKAQYWLADMYENGLGVKTDMTAAIAWLKKSAGHGFVPAEQRLGELYLYGDQTLQDFGRARTWLQDAALAGDGAAQRELGQIYALGLGVPVDIETAYGWYENAVIHGDGMAVHLRDDLVSRMSPNDITKGEQIAKNLAVEIKPA
jgi:TPR repeat protein